MPLEIVRNDITKMKCDAIVNAANSSLCGGGGVDGAIHKAAGEELQEECMLLGSCKVGEAKVTKGYKLPCKYVIHTVGPRWSGGRSGEEEQLTSCYRSSLLLAKEYGCESIAFPLISAGAFGYPADKALRIGMDVIGGFLLENDMSVYIVVYDKKGFQLSKKLRNDIKEYIDECYVAKHRFGRRSEPHLRKELRSGFDMSEQVMMSECMTVRKEKRTADDRLQSLQELIGGIDESFSQMLLRKIDEKGMSDSECYKKANIDRKLFSKIRSDVNYKPSKTTAIAFAIALELSREETEDLLMKAGFALSRSSKFDIIIEYFIKSGNYNIFEINEALFAFDQNLLGGVGK